MAFSAFGFVYAVVQIVIYPPSDLISSAVTFFGLAFFVAIPLISAYLERSGIIVKDKSVRVTLLNTGRISHPDGTVDFVDLVPGNVERALGFIACRRFEGEESAFSSKIVDDRLAGSAEIRVHVVRKESDYVSNRKKERIHQLKVLYFKTRSKRATNGSKVRIVSDAGRLHKEVTLEKSGYFNGIMTTEAFRTIVRETDRSGDVLNESDGTEWFPADVNSRTLAPMPVPLVSGHVGVTPFAMTASGMPMFARQSDWQLIGAGELALRGSGSMDWNDLTNCRNPRDFKSVVAHAIAREIVEESGREESKLAPLKRRLRAEIEEKFFLTGFFRWVERSGKPEFVGIVRLPERIGVDDYDQYEVEAHPILDGMSEIRKAADIVELYERIYSLRQYRVSLSTYMAIRRAAEICRNDKPTSETMEIRRRMLDAIGITG